MTELRKLTPRPTHVRPRELRQLDFMTRSVYALQELRIDTGLRLCANFRSKLAVPPEGEEPLLDPESGKPLHEVLATLFAKDHDPDYIDETKAKEGELSEEGEKIIDLLRQSYRRLTDGVARNRTIPTEKKFRGDPIITDYAEIVLVDSYIGLEYEEGKMFRQIDSFLTKIPIWNSFLKPIRGVGPAMGAVLLSYFDPHRAPRISNFWSYAGLDVGPDNRARGKYASHLVDREYLNKKKEVCIKKSVTFEPWLQARLLGALGPSLMRSSSPYRKFYDDYKHRIITDPRRIKIESTQWGEFIKKGYQPSDLWTKRRVHHAAMRYMVKQLVADFWVAYRTSEGLPLTQSYTEAMQSAADAGISLVSYNEQRRGYAHHGEPPQLPSAPAE